MKFLIIGLTGPLGSGCTTAAEFLSKDIENYSNNVNTILPNIKASIGKYYRYLKFMQEELQKSDMELQTINSDIFLEPNCLLEAIEKAEQGNRHYSEQRSKILNRRLRGLIIKRDIFRAFIKIKGKKSWPNFNIISMSDLIMKLVLQHSIDDEKNESIEFAKYDKDKLPQNIKDKIVKAAKKHNKILYEYDKIIEEKQYSELNYDTCKKIDQAFSEIHELKKEIQNIEHKENEWLQNLGDNLRGTGNPFIEYSNSRFKTLAILANEANKIIKYTRRREDGKKNDFFVIDTFRNPEEVYFFRKRYGSFFLCSIYAKKALRLERLQKHYFEALDNRDQGKGNSPKDLHKQNVPGCVLISDYAINNESSRNDLNYQLIRLLVLINKPGWITPTTEEVFMHMAYSLSLRSRCLSRQVGAVITNEDGFVIGAGWNDVGSGQLGCSLKCVEDYTKYSSPDSLLSVWEKPFECFKDAHLLDKYHDEDYFCFKDVQSDYLIYKKIDENIKFEEIINGVEDGKVKDVLLDGFETLKRSLKDKINVKRLEYARALHAEENAILQVATYGGMGIKGGTIYTTTFPCELCAKKIYQSGIKRIVYTEPYPESISESIFLKDGVRNISIEQFEGVKSNSYYRLFKSRLDRKDMQNINDIYDDDE